MTDPPRHEPEAERKTLAEAAGEVKALMDRLASEGFGVNGWDDGRVIVSSLAPDYEDIAIEPTPRRVG
jgi:hypothetical protein